MKKAKSIVIMLILTIIMSMVIPNISVKAAAPNKPEEYARIEIGGAITGMPEVDAASNITVAYEHGTVVFTGSDMYSAITQAPNDKGQLQDRYVVYTKNDVTVSITSTQEGYTSELWEDGQQLPKTTKTYKGLTANQFIRLDAEFRNDENPAGGNNGPIQIAGGKLVTSNFKYEALGDGDPADIWVNETAVGVGESPDGDKEYYYVESTGKVTFKVATFVNNRMKSIKINGKDYTNQLPKTKAEWLEKNQGQLDIVEFEVPYSAKYNIETTTTFDFDASIGNFLWSYMDKDKAEDDYIGNGKLEFVSLKFNGKTYNSLKELKAANKPYLYYDGNDDEGGAVFPAGAELTVKLVPNAGYQLTTFECNGQAFEPQETVGYYTFEVPSGNFHWGAKFEKVSDVVKASTNAIKSGTLKLGGAETSMAIGTARLDVSDTEVTEEQEEGFEEVAGEYEIVDYLDISLFNTVYKGSAENTWDTEVTNLDNEANISLKLDDSVNYEDVVVIHEKHDGTCEVMKTEYDESTKEASFGTKEFSKYAIAIKGTTEATDEDEDIDEEDAEETDQFEEDDENKTTEGKTDLTVLDKQNSTIATKNTTSSNPATGDNIMMFVSIFVGAIAVMVVVVIVNKSKKGKYE